VQDAILNSFLTRQYEAGRSLADSSDLVDLEPLGPAPVRLYMLRLRCKGLVREPSGAVVEADRFDIGIRFPDDYLRHVNPAEVVTWIGPMNAHHPQVRPPFVCVGRVTPGTSLVDLIYQLFEIVTYTKVTMREDDALNHDACVWARRNLHRLPIDRRPLKRPVALPRQPRSEEPGR